MDSHLLPDGFYEPASSAAQIAANEFFNKILVHREGIQHRQRQYSAVKFSQIFVKDEKLIRRLFDRTY